MDTYLERTKHRVCSICNTHRVSTLSDGCCEECKHTGKAVCLLCEHTWEEHDGRTCSNMPRPVENGWQATVNLEYEERTRDVFAYAETTQDARPMAYADDGDDGDEPF